MNIRASLAFLLIVSAGACTRTHEEKQLAEKHCASCHLYPQPGLLTKQIWKTGIFPEMKLRMGLDLSDLAGTEPEELREILHILPTSPLVSEDDWASIRAYYLKLAPDSLEQQKVNPLQLQQFHPTTVLLNVARKTSFTSISVDERTNRIYLGTRDKKVFVLENGFVLRDSVQLTGPPSDILLSDLDEIFLTSMGIMDPNDLSRGSVVKLDTKSLTSSTIVDSIKRPVNLCYVDLNNNGSKDFLVSAFGNFTGGLYAIEENNGNYVKHTIHGFPGNRKSIVRDFNDDGLPDIMTLITQGDERIALFTNRGGFRYSYQVLLKFPPVYGSSYFELADFNADGHPDILYTNGDNADYSMILKPYHAIRIFLNDGHNKFSESWHHPMHGASMAKAVDFDADGDLDIAAISFFPDFAHHPEHSFIYFENLNGKFVPYATMMAAKGRWITMESADIDQDGDQDIVLAALNFPTAVPQDLLDKWNEDKVSLLVLKNNHKGQQ